MAQHTNSTLPVGMAQIMMHDRQMVDRMPSPQGFAAPGALHSSGVCQDNYVHLSRAHEDGYSELSAVWSSPTGRLDGLPAYASPIITHSPYSDERMRECVPLSGKKLHLIMSAESADEA
jgi:hypothetical protein